MLVVLLTLTILLSGALEIRAEYKGPALYVYLFKPLTILLIILLALQDKHQTTPFYQCMIVAGLSCSLIGDIFLMLPRDRFIPGLVSFLFAHLFYLAAFNGGEFAFSSLAYVIPFVLYGAIMLRLLFPYLGRMKIPVLVYMLVILLMGWQAASRYVMTGATGSGPACAGALLFMASDSLLALNRFTRRFDAAQALILSTYFIAQWLIALSV